MKELTRITTNPAVMGGKPYLEEPDIAEALTYAAWRAEEIEVPLASV